MILLLATPASAKCHHYSHWAFNYPQRCHVMALAPATKPLRFRNEPLLLPPERITLPDMVDIQWAPDGDEHLRGLALLRALRQ
jgi:hypothetical protein